MNLIIFELSKPICNVNSWRILLNKKISTKIYLSSYFDYEFFSLISIYFIVPQLYQIHNLFAFLYMLNSTYIIQPIFDCYVPVIEVLFNVI